MSRLSELHDEYEQIMCAPASEARDRSLSRLMDSVKSEFGVPLLQDIEWERRNPAVIALYRKISMSRTGFGE